MKVQIERFTYQAPTRKDHLIKIPRQFLYMSRFDEYKPAETEEELLKAAEQGFLSDDLEHGKILVVSGIVCDACNDPIMSPYVWILVIGGRPWGTQCENCRQRYHSKKPAYIAQIRKPTFGMSIKVELTEQEIDWLLWALEQVGLSGEAMEDGYVYIAAEHLHRKLRQAKDQLRISAL